jgi:hypothetical protein
VQERKRNQIRACPVKKALEKALEAFADAILVLEAGENPEPPQEPDLAMPHHQPRRKAHQKRVRDSSPRMARRPTSVPWLAPAWTSRGRLRRRPTWSPACTLHAPS